MIRRVCCVCHIQYGEKPDGKSEESDSHGYCEHHAAEAMANIEIQFAELPDDLARMEVA